MNRAFLLLAVLLTAPLAEAGVLVVDAAGGGDFTTLTDAVAAALSGDTLLVRDGTYDEAGPVVIDGKGLTIAGEWSLSVHTLTTVVRPGLVVRNLPPATRVVLQNLVLIAPSGTSLDPPAPALVLRDNVSHVRLQSCVLRGGHGAEGQPDGAAGVDALDSASTAFVGCLVQGGNGQFSPNLGVVTGDGGPGLVTAAGQVLTYDSSFAGGAGGSNLIGGWPQGGAGGTGLVRSSGTLFLVGSTFWGGDGGTAHNGGAGGHGLALGGPGPAWLLSGTFSGGGQGGFSDFGPNGQAGLDTVDPGGVVTDTGGTVHGFDLTSPLREREQGTLRFGGGSADQTMVFASADLHQLPLPWYQGVLMLSPTALLGPVTFGPPGDQDVPFSMPDMGPGFEAFDWYVQPAYLGPDGIVLGPGRVLTLVDASF